jgi:plasmid stability protein
MEQALIRRLKPGTLAAYRAHAAGKGTSLEAELRAVIEQHAPVPAKDGDALLALSRRLRARTIQSADSASYIRHARDTNADRLDEAS